MTMYHNPAKAGKVFKAKKEALASEPVVTKKKAPKAD